MADWGSVHHHARYMVAAEKTPRRRMCGCGCRKRVTHRGMCNGVCLTEGCELQVRRWVKDWENAYGMPDRAARRGN